MTENAETIEANENETVENVSEAADEQTNENVDQPEDKDSIVEGEVQAESEQQPETEDEIEDIQDALTEDGKVNNDDAYAYIRKSFRDKYEGKIGRLEQQIEALKQQRAIDTGNDAYQDQYLSPEELQNRTIFDPLSNQYIDVNSPAGQLIVQEKIRAEREQLKQQKHMEAEQVKYLQKVRDELDEAALIYKNFDESRSAVQAVASEQMAAVVLESPKKAAIINYLGKNPTELAKFKNLSPVQQMREVIRLEEKLKPSRKLSTKASAPVDQVNTSLNKGSSVVDMSMSEMKERYKQRTYGTSNKWQTN